MLLFARMGVIKGASGSSSKAISAVTVGTAYKYNSGYPTKYNNGDTYHNTWSDDGKIYTVECDDDNWNGSGSSNLSVSTLSTFDSSTTGTLVNAMAAWGTGGQKGSDNACYKATGLISIGGVLYMWVNRTFYLALSPSASNSDNIQTTAGAQLIKSTNKGVTWTPAPPSTVEPYASPMFASGKFTAPGFVQYGQDYTDPGVHNAGTYVYAVSPNAVWNNGDTMIIGRCLKSVIGNLSASDWSFYQGGDGSLDASWGSISTAANIISNTRKVGQAAVQYLPALKRYIMLQWYYPGVVENVNTLDPKYCTWDIYESPTPWGTWTRIGSQTFWPNGLYNPIIAAKSVSTDNGLNIVALAAGNWTSSTQPGTDYTLTLVPLTITPAANGTPVAYTDPAMALDPSKKNAAITLSNSNLTATNTSTGTTTPHAFALGTRGHMAGKWYFEVTNTAGSSGAGIAWDVPTQGNYKSDGLYLLYGDNSYLVQALVAEGAASTTANWASGRVGVAVDLDNKKIAWYNGTNWANNANPVAGTNMTAISTAATYFPAIYAGNNTATSVSNAVFSNFAYSVPSGYSAW